MNSCTSLCSSLNNGYILSFLNTNTFFISIVWFYTFIGIFLLCFFSNTQIHLWNFSGTNFFTSSSDFTTSSFLFYISHHSATFFTFIILSLFGLFFFFFSFLFFSSFCFYHPDFPYFSLYCLPHFTEHLVIFTSSVLQLISELWYASHIISKITLHFCLPIIFFSIFYNSAQSGQIFHSYNNFSLCACPLHKSLFSFFLLLFAEDI